MSPLQCCGDVHARRLVLQHHAGAPSRVAGLRAVPQPVHNAHEHAGLAVADAGAVAADLLALLGHGGDLDEQWANPVAGLGQRHFTALTTVPTPGSEVTSKSSISRRTPGSPIPRLRLVEYPSCSARPMSAMPGPSSRATIRIPRRPPSSSIATSISPCVA